MTIYKKYIEFRIKTESALNYFQKKAEIAKQYAMQDENDRVYKERTLKAESEMQKVDDILSLIREAEKIISEQKQELENQKQMVQTLSNMLENKLPETGSISFHLTGIRVVNEQAEVIRRNKLLAYKKENYAECTPWYEIVAYRTNLATTGELKQRDKEIGNEVEPIFIKKLGETDKFKNEQQQTLNVIIQSFYNK